MVRPGRAPAPTDTFLQRLIARFRPLTPEEPMAAVPLSDEEIAAAAARIDLPIPEACKPGVAANLALIERHVAVMRGAAIR